MLHRQPISYLATDTVGDAYAKGEIVGAQDGSGSPARPSPRLYGPRQLAAWRNGYRAGRLAGDAGKDGKEPGDK